MLANEQEHSIGLQSKTRLETYQVVETVSNLVAPVGMPVPSMYFEVEWPFSLRFTGKKRVVQKDVDYEATVPNRENFDHSIGSVVQ